MRELRTRIRLVFAARSSLILCPLERVHTIITDDGVAQRDARLVEQSGIRLIVAAREAGEGEASSSAAGAAGAPMEGKLA